MGLTREISVRYLKPVRTNTEIIVEAQIIAQDEQEVVLRSTVRSIDNVLLAEGESKWSLVSLSTIAKISNVDESTLEEFLVKYSTI
jgi:acyl-CoA thioesterase FadM